jgi:hypothetical protein
MQIELLSEEDPQDCLLNPVSLHQVPRHCGYSFKWRGAGSWRIKLLAFPKPDFAK